LSLEWQDVVLKDVLSEKGYIRGPFGSALKRSEMKSEGIPVYEQQNAIYNNRNFRYYIDDDKYQSLKRFTTVTDDLIISCSGTVGKVSIIKENDPKGIISQALLTLRVNKELILPEFLKYFFSSYEGYNSLVSRSTGSVQVNISKRAVIEEIPLKLPPLDIQRNIVYYLQLIDAKIENCNSINRNLAKLIDLSFKNYLLNFDKYAEDELASSEFGPIPKGWKVSNLTGIANYQNGLAMQKFPPESSEESFKVLKIKELRQGYFDETSDSCSKNIKEECIVYDGDVIFSWSGSLLVDIWTGGMCGLNQHLFKVTSSNFDKWFYYCWTKFYLDQFILIAKDKATTMGHIKRKHLDESLVLIPDNMAYKKLTNLFKPLFDYLIKNKMEIKNLQKLRDTLLPKLMSGEIDVSEINCDMQEISTNNWDNKFTVPLQNNLIKVIS